MAIEKSTRTKRRAPVSVLIPTKNEEANMEECLRSVAWADDIVVVDSNSKDSTCAIARRHGARVVNFDWNGRFPKKKNWALANVDWRHDWVLILDADERITPPLAREIARVVRDPDHAKVGYYINRRFMFMGGWLRHCGYYPSWNLRLFKHTEGRYERLEVSGDTQSGDNEVHEHVVIANETERVGHLRHDMLHYAYPSIDVWIEKHNRYSNWEARVNHELHDDSTHRDKLAARLFSANPLERKRWIKRAARRLPCRPTLRFLYHYVWKQGFRDGTRGLIFCRLLAWYEFVSLAKAREMRDEAAREWDG